MPRRLLVASAATSGSLETSLETTSKRTTPLVLLQWSAASSTCVVNPATTPMIVFRAVIVIFSFNFIVIYFL